MKPKKASKPAPAPSVNQNRLALLPYILLFLLACGVYANTLANGFVSDDHFLLVGNPLIASQNISATFQHGIWFYVGSPVTNYFRPVQAILYIALYSIFGFSPPAFHFALILAHGVNTLLIFALARRLLHSRGAATVAGALFAVHPVHTEAVDWATVPDVYLAMAVFAALLWFVSTDAAPRKFQIAGLAALSFLALLIKEPALMLAPLFAAYELLYLRRPLRALWDNRALYASLTAVFAAYMVLRIHALGGIAPGQGNHYHLAGATLVWSIAATLGQYFLFLIAPVPLNYFHFFAPSTSPSLPVLAAIAVEAAIVAAVFRCRSRAPLLSFALFFILVPLLPALNLNGVGEAVFGERYLYLPSAGFVLLAGLAWQWLAARNRRVAWGVAAIVTATSATVAVARNADWHDDDRLLQVTIASSPKAAAPLSDLASLDYQRGDYAGAIENYRRALALQPDRADIRTNLASAYQKEGRYPEAVAELRKAVALDPGDAKAHMSLGLALDAVDDIPGAIAEDRRALDLQPDYADACSNLGLALIKQKDYAGAIGYLRRAIGLKPGSFEARFNLGLAYSYSDRFADAVGAFQGAIGLDPGNANIYLAHYYLGLAYSHLNSASAAEEFSAALQLRPDFMPAKDALAGLPHRQ